MRRFFTVAAIGAVVLYASDAARQQKLQQAIELMESKGDFVNAMPLFQEAARSADRALAARALLYVAQCQERQGKELARTTYERVVKEFSDQKETAAEAGRRLAALGRATEMLTARKILAGAEVDPEASITPDGRFMAMTDPSTEDLAIRDMSTGVIKRLMLKTSLTERRESGSAPVLSPDLRLVAYYWYTPKSDSYSLRVAASEPGAKPRILVNNPEIGYLEPRGWSNDSKSVLTVIWDRDNTSRLAWVSLDGAIKTLKSMEWRNPGPVSLSPDGKYIAYDVLVRREASDREIRVLAADASSETVLAQTPGINAGPIWTPDANRVLFKSNRSGSFGLWSVSVRAGKQDGPAELAKADIGNIQLKMFTRTGSLYYLQQHGQHDVFVADFDSASGNIRGDGVRLVDTYVGSNISPAWSPDGKSIAYLCLRPGQESGSGETLVVRSLDTGQEHRIPGTFLYGAPPLWFPDGEHLLDVSRDKQNHVSFYKVDLKTGAVEQLLSTDTYGPPNAALSPDGKTVYATLGKGVVAFDLASGRQSEIYALGGKINSLASSPADGRLAIVVWRSRPNGGREERSVSLMNPDGSGLRDVYRGDAPGTAPGVATWSADGRTIYFTRGPETQLWRVDASGGTPEYAGFTAKNIGDIDVSRDGSRLVFGAGRIQTELWALENLGQIWKTSR